MPVCKQCNVEFPNRIKIDDRWRNIQRRQYCVKCSPFGLHNTKQIHLAGIPVKRICRKCGEKDSKKFYGHKKSLCGKCSTKENVAACRAKKQKAIELMGGSCKYCGYNKCAGSMDFHHTNAKLKDKNFHHMRFWSWNRIVKELKKCELVCKNCHGEIHAKMYNGM